MKARHPKRIILAAVIVAVIIILAIIGVAQRASAPQNSGNDAGGNSGGQTMCTMDAKICPDGSSVGRSGPDCEFEPCPGETPSNRE